MSAGSAGDFEARRRQNITRNEQFLKSIGLAELKSNIENSKPDYSPDVLDEYTRRRRKKPVSEPAAPGPPLRRSVRRVGGADTSKPEGNRTGNINNATICYLITADISTVYCLLTLTALRRRLQEASGP